MKCACPKCDAAVEIQDQKISASPSSQQCPDCNDKYWFRQEKFALRAYRKSGRVYCFGCGHELGSEILCLNCGSLCPDYCVVQSPKFVKHQQQRAGYSFSLPQLRSESARPHRAAKTARQPGSTNWLVYAVLVVLVLAVAGGLGKFYLDNQAEEEYARNFIVALYGVKSGTDLGLGLIDGISSQWQKNLDAGGIAPNTGQKDLDKLGQVKKRVTQAMATLDECPEKFAEARQKLVRLHRIYEDIYALNVAMPSSLGELNSSEDRLKENFFKAADDLRRSMPAELSDELKSSVSRYRNLNFMVKG